MKKSINIWSFPSSMTINECMQTAKNAGYNAIELSLNEMGPLSLESKDDEIISYRAAAQKIGIEISSLATGLYWSYSLTSNDENIRQKAKSIVKKQIDFACLLGTDAILVVPGAVGADFIPEFDIVDYDVAYDRAYNALKELAEYAQKKGIYILLENVWNKFLLSPLEMRDFIDKIGSMYIGCYLDVGNIIYTGYPEQWIKILGRRIKRVHFKDFRKDAGGINGFVDLLSGDVNYPAVIEALQRCGYDSYVTAEMIPPVPFYRHYSDQIIYNASASMERIINSR